MFEWIKGKQAEQRVINVANGMGHIAYPATPEEDGAGKTDVFINGLPVQVSCTGKSKRQKETLERRCIACIEAGEQVSDDCLRGNIRDVLRKY